MCASRRRRRAWSPTRCADCRRPRRWTCSSRTNKRAAKKIRKVLDSAVANADDQGGDVDELVVESIVVNEGPRMKRMRASARGRPAPYVHRLAHIVVTVSQPRDEEDEFEGFDGA